MGYKDRNRQRDRRAQQIAVLSVAGVLGTAAIVGKCTADKIPQPPPAAVTSPDLEIQINAHQKRMQAEMAGLSEAAAGDYLIGEIMKAASLRTRGMMEETSENYYEYQPRFNAITRTLRNSSRAVRENVSEWVEKTALQINEKQPGYETTLKQHFGASYPDAAQAAAAEAKLRSKEPDFDEAVYNEVSSVVEDLQAFLKRNR